MITSCCGSAGCWRCCDDCNFDDHYCGGCGEVLSHSDGGACPNCSGEYDIALAGAAAPQPPDKESSNGR